MRFDANVVLALTAFISHVSAFGVPKQSRSFTVLRAKSPEYDLTVPVFDTLAPEPVVSKPAKKGKEPKKKAVEVNEVAPEPTKEKKLKKEKPPKKALQPKPEKVEKPKKEKPQRVEKPKKEKPQKLDKVQKVEKTKEKVVKSSSSSLPKPKAPKESPSSPFALPVGVALGAAPLVTLPVLALLASRTTLQNTKDKRDEIQSAIAQTEARKAARKEKQTDIDLGGLIKAGAFLGAGVVSLSLIIIGPMVMEGAKLPSLGGSGDAKEKVAPAATAKASSNPLSKISLPSKPIGSKKESKAPDGYNLDASAGKEKTKDKKVKAVKVKKPSAKEIKAQEEADAKAKVEAEEKAKAEAEVKAKAEAEIKAKEDAEVNAKADAEAKIKADEQAKIQAQTDAKAKAEADVQAKIDAEIKSKQDNIDAVIKAKQEKIDADTKAKADAAAATKAASQAKLDAQVKAKEEARALAANATPETRAKAEARAKAQAELDVTIKARADEAAKIKEAAAVKAAAKAEATINARLEVKAQAEAQAAARAEAQAAIIAESKAKAQAQAEAAAAARAEKGGQTAAVLDSKALSKVEKQAAFKASAEAKSKTKEADLIAKTKAKAIANTPEKNPVPKKTKPGKVTGTGLGAIQGKETGGKVLPKETLDEGVVDFLKKYN